MYNLRICNKRWAWVASVLFGILFLFSSFRACSVAFEENDIIARWDFETAEREIVKDENSNDNPGIIRGAQRTKGRAGKGMSFDGKDDLIEIPHSPLFGQIEQFTARLWFRPKVNLAAGLGGLQVRPTFIKKPGTLYFHYDGRGFVCGKFVNEEDMSYQVSIGREYLKDRWYYLALVYDGRNLKLYENGLLLCSSRAEGILQDTGTLLWIGGAPATVIHPGLAYDGLINETFDGVLDEVIILNRSLSPERIKVDYLKFK